MLVGVCVCLKLREGERIKSFLKIKKETGISLRLDFDKVRKKQMRQIVYKHLSTTFPPEQQKILLADVNFHASVGEVKKAC